MKTQKKKTKSSDDENEGKINLWNTTHKKFDKTTRYIDSLEPKSNWFKKEPQKFEKIKKEALATKEPNEMLEIIGFNPLGKDRIYEQAEE